MAWLQSSFTNHQLIAENGGNNLRKGYKVGSLKKNSDPDKSNTPLLHDSPVSSSKTESDVTDWLNDANVAEPKKTNILHNITSKPSFLSSSFFDRSSNIVKTKPLPDVNKPLQTASGFTNKPKDEQNSLCLEKNKEKLQLEEDDDSDDEWFTPHASRGYQRVKTGAD